MSAHTPGPWIAVGRWVEHPDDAIPDICTTNPDALGQDGRSDEECCANARLIAAAPDMLEALQALEVLFATLARDSTSAMWIDKAREAIAKATGNEVGAA